MRATLFSAAILVASIGFGYMLSTLLNHPLTNRRLMVGGSLTIVAMLLLIAATLA